MGRHGRRTKYPQYRRALGCLWAALLLAVGAVGDAAHAESVALEEVVVLAQKRPTELGQVPMALSLLESADLEAQGIHNIEDLAARSPMLDLEESVTAATTTLRVRGIGNLGNIPTFEP